MKKLKMDYESPSTNLFNLRIERSILTGSVNAMSNALPNYDEDFDDWD